MGISLKNIKVNVNISSVFTDNNGASPDDIIDINAIYADGASAYLNNSALESQKIQDVLNKKVDNLPTPSETQSLLSSGTEYDSTRFDSAWDPRLKRLDAFIYNGDNPETAVRVPFGSMTTATLFHDQVYTLEKVAAQGLLDAGRLGSISEAYNVLLKQTSDVAPTNETTGNAQTSSTADSDAIVRKNSDKLIITNLKKFENDPYSYGVQSLMNPYSLTRLMGGLSNVNTENVTNHMYDIRDRRRFYDAGGSDDVFAVSNPTVSNLIAWANNDKWGRTPYAFLDFVYCKYFNIIPNNRLITLRRYHAPTYDNLNFEDMWGEIETAQKDENGMNKPENSKINNIDKLSPQGVFSPVATVVTYFGGDSGNSIGALLNFTTGINWTDLEAKIHEVSGNEGDSPQAVIDKMFDGGKNGFGSMSTPTATRFLETMSKVSHKIFSFGKFALGTNGTFGSSQEVVDSRNAAMSDPYSDGPYENKILGPLNRIQSVKKRQEGIKFSQQFTIKCSYISRGIGGMNPKAELLDILGNCMSIVSPDAVFWGGGHRYMINPKVYPFHDGGWRDSFMKAIYNGKVLGNDGALSIIGSGIKKVACDENGNFDSTKLTSSLGNGLGEIMGAISAGLSALASNVAIGGLSEFLSSASSFVAGGGEKVSDASALASGAEKFTNMVKNIQGMWHDKVLQQTTFPKITGTGALLIGEPVGEWHLTIGNPLNPIAVVGNLICSDMKVEWEEELGPDDFPIGFSVTYTLEHGMARDRSGIQSMFNKGMGKFYCLPDYTALSSNMETKVDRYTGNSNGLTGNLDYLSPLKYAQVASRDGVTNHGYNIRKISSGMEVSPSKNPNTQVLTKFTPPETFTNMTLADIRNTTSYVNENNIPVIRSLAITRKWNG